MRFSTLFFMILTFLDLLFIIHMLKYFCIWFRFLGDIRIYKKNSSRCHLHRGVSAVFLSRPQVAFKGIVSQLKVYRGALQYWNNKTLSFKQSVFLTYIFESTLSLKRKILGGKNIETLPL